MTCPMCGRESDAARRPLGESVYVFCCDLCVTGVLRTFARHDPERDDEGSDGPQRDDEVA